MSWIWRFFKSPMGKKAVMAVTGIVLFGFVLGHMLGNLKVYQGPEKFNHYAESLRIIGEPFLGHSQALWIARGALLLAVGLHILSAWQVSRLNLQARPASYVKKKPVASTYASRTMRWGGVIIALFVVYHLLHLTFGSVHPDFVHGDAYHNLVVGFRDPLVSGFYMVAVIALGLHLFHGLWSMLQTLGVSGPRIDPARRVFALVFALVITAGNLSFPLAVLTGIVR